MSPAGRIVRSVQVVDPVEHRLRLEIVALLFLKKEIDPALAGTIRTAFSTTNVAVDPVDDVEAKIIPSKAKMDDYQVDLSFRLVKVADPIVSDMNWHTFLSQMEAYRDPSGRPYFDIHVQDKVEQLCEAPAVPLETLPVKDVDHPQQEIREQESGEHLECENLEITDTRIGTAFQYYEWKTELLVRPIRIGPCTVMYTKIPVFFSRITKMALWGYTMSRPETKRNSEKAITRCLILAAVNTAVLGIVTGGLGFAAAAVAFSAAALTCIEISISDAIDCLFVNLRLVAEHSDWEEKVF
jgi:hypothetical protein